MKYHPRTNITHGPAEQTVQTNYVEASGRMELFLIGRRMKRRES